MVAVRAETDQLLLNQAVREVAVRVKREPLVHPARQGLPGRDITAAMAHLVEVVVAVAQGKLDSMAVETMEAMAEMERKSPSRELRPTTLAVAVEGPRTILTTPAKAGWAVVGPVN